MILIAVLVLFSASAHAGDMPAGADARDPFGFANFGEAAGAAAETSGTGDYPYGVNSEGYCAALIQRNGRCFRAVAFLDEHGKELYAAYQDALSDPGKNAEEAYRTLDGYLMTLPVRYTEELAVVPLTREELDAMAGKTLWELVLEPCGMHIFSDPDNIEAGKDIVFRASKGFCEYELVINESAETYHELRAAGRNPNDYLNLTVRAVKYSRISHNALNLNYLADGTEKRDAGELSEGSD